MPSVLDFLPLFAEDASTIRARIDADANDGLTADDPRYVDTREGTFFYDVTQPLVLEFARIYDALGTEVPAAAMAVFAWGDYLDWHAEVFGLERKIAVRATGEVIFRGDPASLVGVGTIVSTAEVDEEGEVVEFQTTESGTTSAGIEEPTGLVGTPSASGGTLASDDYYYQASAYNAFGETLGSEEIVVTVTGPTGSVALNWPDVTGATGYKVYRGLAEAGEKGLIYTGATSAYTDDNSPTPGVLGPPNQNLTAGVTLAVEAIDAGTAGNVAAYGITEIDSPNLAIDAVSNPQPTTGGSDLESDVALRERILLEFQGSGAGNINDYRRWALEEPGVGRVSVIPAFDGPNTVLVVVMAADGSPVAGSVITALQDRLDPTPGLGEGEAPIGAEVTIATPTTQSIDVDAIIEFAPGFSLDGGGGSTARREALEAVISAYIDALDIGDDVIYEHVKATLFRVEGVYNISGVEVDGGTADVTITSDPPVKPVIGAITLN